MPGANVALSRRDGRIQPRQFGPSIRMGCPRSQALSSASRARPASPASRNPAEITTAPRTPLATQSFRAGRTAGAGTAITARSTGSSIARSDAVAGSPWTMSPREFTGQIRPSNPAARRLATTLPPTFVGSREAPTTATLRGSKKAARSPGTSDRHSSAPRDGRPSHQTRKPGALSGVVAIRWARDGP